MRYAFAEYLPRIGAGLSKFEDQLIEALIDLEDAPLGRIDSRVAGSRQTRR